MNSSVAGNRHRLWQASLGLAQKVVHDYLHNPSHLEDARQEVMLALWEATANWQEGVHSSFEQYAFYVMRGKLFRYLTEKAEDRPILSNKEKGVLASLRKTMRAGQLLSCSLMAEISKESGIGMFRLQQIVSYWYGSHISLTAAVFEPLSEPTTSLEQYLLDTQQEASLEKALSTLSERERLIIAARFLEDPRQKLSQIAKTLDISIERVRVLEGKSLKKLRAALEQKS